MSKLSSDTLFHFTTWDNLINILENGFQPKFSLEKFCFRKGEASELAIPMVSFCDIPLSQIKLHVKRYGSYGLGLTKSWGIAKGMNPVLYLKEDSNLSKNLMNSLDLHKFLRPIIIKSFEAYRKDLSSIISELELCIGKPVDDLKRVIENLEHFSNDLNKGSENVHNTSIAIEALAKISTHIKPYEGYSSRKGARKEGKVRFYDEREWRYVPNLESYNAELSDLGFVTGLMPKKSYDNRDIRRKANALIQTGKLSFKPNFIRYIIVKEEAEILEMITKLERIKGDKYPANTIKILTSRILTYDQIEKDF